MRTRNCELGGLGHPLVDELIKTIQRPDFSGDVAILGAGRRLYAHYLIQRRDDRGQLSGRVFTIRYDADTGETLILQKFEIPATTETLNPIGPETVDVDEAKRAIESALDNAIIQWLPDRASRSGIQKLLLGLHLA